ncbi:hypothetical protein CANMA_004823 [Candida margitis]|uniref:uncharacterized protein n=1 Tax=Candida margitis TaxID=1775924 RepID=UPI0022270624|nr:uncharacterized protein CANMA_004823 [Candida margitis]KAI5953984.1 hypothetical protein CANMA_004823 [Candida margitis]
MKFLTQGFSASLFKQSSKCFSTPYEQPPSSKLKSVFVLRNIILWLVLMNLKNFCLDYHYAFGKADIVRVLSETGLGFGLAAGSKTNFEDILVGIYVRNEELYSENIDSTTIIADVALHIVGHGASLILKEGFYESESFRTGNNSTVESVIKMDFPQGPNLFHVGKACDVISELLEVPLETLFSKPMALHLNQKIATVFTLVVVFKSVIFITSMLLVVVYLVLYYSPKPLFWHYINLSTLYVLDMVILAMVLGLLVTWCQLNSKTNYELFFLILELVSIMGLNLVFFQSHQAIMINSGSAYSASSSIYSSDDPQNTPPIVHKTSTSPSTGEGLTGKTVTRTYVPMNQTAKVVNRQANVIRCFTAPAKSSVEWQ